MPQDPCTILLIDDSPEDCELVRDLLPAGYTFVEAGTVAEGLALMREGKIDCVLSDLKLPDATGLEMLLETRNLVGHSAPPIVLLTGSYGDDIGLQAIQLGAQDLLLKDELSAGLLQRTIRHARERHRLERASRQPRLEWREFAERFQLACEAAGVSYWDWDRNKDIVFVSKTHLPLYGLPPSSSITLQGWLNTVHEEDRDRARDAMQRALLEESTCGWEVRTTWPDGSVHWVASRGRLAPGFGKGEARLIGLAWDITALKETEEQLRATIKKLTHANEETRDFAYDVAHDLRAPIRTVSVCAQKLAADLGEQKLAIEGPLQRIQKGMRRMDDLVQSLNAFVSAGNAPNAPTEGVALSEAMQDCLSNLQSQIEEAKAIIRVFDLPEIRYHRSALVQLLQNLVENALRYRKTDLAPEVDIRASYHRDEVHVSVRDNGQGFEQRFAEQIFQAFQRLHGTAHSGSGLGLATCSRIVARFGGRIWAESALGVGSTFYFSVPKHLIVEPIAAHSGSSER